MIEYKKEWHKQIEEKIISRKNVKHIKKVKKKYSKPLFHRIFEKEIRNLIIKYNAVERNQKI